MAACGLGGGFAICQPSDNPDNRFYGVNIPVKILGGSIPQEEPIKVFINGKQINFDQPPIILNGRTLVPFRAIFEELGATVDWTGSAPQTVVAVKDDLTIFMCIGSNILVRNGERIALDVTSQLVGSRTMFPARAVAEAFGAAVEWDGETQSVIITY